MATVIAPGTVTTQDSDKDRKRASDDLLEDTTRTGPTADHQQEIDDYYRYDANAHISRMDKDPQQLEEERLKDYARLLDSAIRLPGGFRIGLDGIVGLIPGIGDLLGAGLSSYFIYAAARLGIPKSVVARMIINTLIETVIGAIPIIGDVFDFIFKANDRNARLLHAALEERNRRQGRAGTLDA